ncbi:MAG: hypothetical protein U0169_03475 [Polyangiaceae bacterium]
MALRFPATNPAVLALSLLLGALPACKTAPPPGPAPTPLAEVDEDGTFDPSKPIGFVTFEANGARPREMRVFFYAGGKRTSPENADRVGLWRGEDFYRATRTSKTAERTVFRIDEGLFAGGEFIVHAGPGSVVELVTFGSGVPEVARERGTLSIPL